MALLPRILRFRFHKSGQKLLELLAPEHVCEMDMPPGEASKTCKHHRRSESGDEDETDGWHRLSSARQMTVQPGCPPSDSESDDGVFDEDEDEVEEVGEYYFSNLLWEQKFNFMDPAAITSSVAEPRFIPLSDLFLPPQSRSFPDLDLPPHRRALYRALVQKLKQIGTTTGQWPGQTMAVVKSEQQDILASIGMLLVMDEGEFEFWAGLYGEAKLSEREAHWDVKYPAKARQVLEAWVQRKRVVYEDVADQVLREDQRHALGRAKDSIYLAELNVREWYKERCILTGYPGTEAVPIFPDFLTEDDKKALWDALSWFWPSEFVQDWRKAVDEPGYEKTNLLIIGVGHDDRWANAALAFRPLQTSDDGNGMCLQFFYLSHPLSDMEILEYENPDPRSQRIYFDRGEYVHLMQSGDIVNIRSVDTTQYPLPNFHLLELQWHLNRAMRAAANPELLEILFDDNGYDDGAERDSYKPTPYDPCARHTPWFSHYLIDCAVEEGIIRPKDVPLWKARLDPDGEIRDGGPGWIYYKFERWEYIVDHDKVDWPYVADYDWDGKL
ncbi:hypothetical protein CONLIGDRAFT_127343 [Coniochaeta ligniaria NRRL 30616]|uniref:Uncharacterized protein n=1 Tax=Coniochaeta ligniaria NRRL 30616 TaxID=1408157 RepID=A0A1J7J2R4_9PEZI|nr:hypothetical protein CONLIGDRAFT_127343 [Coniochaeta ligniaria NRRL 30616]